MACREKRRYRTKLDAEIALSRVDAATAGAHDTQRPVRVYRCPHCRGWHLTSQARRGDGTWRAV
jgi:hypothetical protein